MKRIVLLAMTLCMSLVLAACGGGANDGDGGNGSADNGSASQEDTSTAESPVEGITQSVYDDAMEFFAVNDQFDAGLIDRAAASKEAETIHDRLDRNATTERDFEVAAYLRSALLKFKEPVGEGTTAEAYEAMYERQIERAKDVLQIEY